MNRKYYLHYLHKIYKTPRPTLNNNNTSLKIKYLSAACKEYPVDFYSFLSRDKLRSTKWAGDLGGTGRQDI